MKTDVYKLLRRLTYLSGAASLALVLAATALSQEQPKPAAVPGSQPATTTAEGRAKLEAARDQVRDAAKGARETAEAAREGARDATRDNRASTQDTRDGARDTTRDERRDTRDVREGARDTAQSERQDVREARRDLRDTRREFRAERIRSGDLGVWLRTAANRLMVSDIAGSGAIAQSGLKEGDQIISVNGQHVANEREFVDRLFAGKDTTQPVPVVVSRNGQQQTINIQTKAFVDEYTVGDANSLDQYGIIIDDSTPDHLRVKAVIPRSPAFYAGVKSGDQITSVRGQRIKEMADLVRGLVNSVGGSTSIEVNRNNQSRQLDIDIPGENAEPRTALRPNLDQPAPNQPTRTQPANPLLPRQQPGAKTPADAQPRLNPPR